MNKRRKLTRGGNAGDHGGSHGGWVGGEGGAPAGGIGGSHGGWVGGGGGALEGWIGGAPTGGGSQGGWVGGGGGAQGGAFGGAPVGGIGGGTWAIVGTLAYERLLAALRSIDHGLTAMEGSQRIGVESLKVIRSCFNQSSEAVPLMGYAIDLLREILAAGPGTEAFDQLPNMVETIGTESQEINIGALEIDNGFLALGNSGRSGDAAAEVYCGLGTLHYSLAVFQQGQWLFKANPNMFVGCQISVPLWDITPAGRGVEIWLLNSRFPDGIGNGAPGGVATQAIVRLRNIHVAVQVLWKAHSSIHCGVKATQSVYIHKNPIANVTSAVAFLQFYVRLMPTMIFQMLDALVEILQMITHAQDLGHNLVQILHLFPNQMHWISDAAENIHNSGNRIHNALLVCIENQILCPEQTQIHFGLAQVHLALAKILLAARFFADIQLQ